MTTGIAAAASSLFSTNFLPSRCRRCSVLPPSRPRASTEIVAGLMLSSTAEVKNQGGVRLQLSFGSPKKVMLSSLGWMISVLFILDIVG